MNDNVKKFFDMYNSDSSLRERLKEAEMMYPGSLEIREAVVENVVLPVAKELGLEFTVEDLRVYEALLWKDNHADVDIKEGDPDEEEVKYWLLGRGWSNDEARFCGDKK